MLSNFLYQRKFNAVLKQRQITHRFLNIKAIQQVVVAFECDDYSSLRIYEKEIRQALTRFPKVILVVNIKGVKNEELNFAAGHQDILISKDDLNYKIIPSAELIEKVDVIGADMFINLEREKSPVVDFLTGITKAPLRVGIEGKSELCDLMINVKGRKEIKQFFSTLLSILQSIN